MALKHLGTQRALRDLGTRALKSFWLLGTRGTLFDRLWATSYVSEELWSKINQPSKRRF